MIDKQIFQVPASVTGVKSMSRCLRIQVDTQEILDGDMLSVIFQWMSKVGYFTFSSEQIEATDLIDLPPITRTEKKTKSQQLREVLWRIWSNQFSDKYDEFQDYYDYAMDRLIGHYKEKLNE